MGQGKVVRELQGLQRALLEPRESYENRAPRRTLRNDSFHPLHKRAGDRGTPVQVKNQETVDVIDLGAPGYLRVINSQKKRQRRYRYTPNPRLYPGPSPNKNINKNYNHHHHHHNNNNNNNNNNNSISPGPQRGRRRKRVYCRPVPNSRLYRPAPARLPPPPASPSAPWPPPPAPTNALETASNAALRLSERRVVWRPPSPKTSKLRTRSQKPVPRTTVAKDQSSILKRRALRSKVSSSRAPTSNKAPAKRLWSKASSKVRSPDSQRLVVTLPAAGDAQRSHLETVTYRYRPASEHFRARVLESDSGTSSPHACVPSAWASRGMDAHRYSTSAEDCSEGNDSAPSEFLAEFLSAIMQRQYAEALKYCRLILQYEPNNATAHGFYPLLQQKLAQAAQAQQSPPVRPAHARVARAARVPRPARVRHTDSLLDVSSGSSGEENADHSPSTPPEVMEQEADSAASCSGSWSPCEAGAAVQAGPRRSGSSGSVASQSSLELDSSEAPAAHSSPDPSYELSRRTERTDSASGSGAGWESSGSAPPSSACDDNGNPAPRAPSGPDTYACDEENNERSQPPSPCASFAARTVVLKSEESSASLRRLRAQYTCSIK